ncbi:MAG TPA: hypothetical protein VKE94_13410 [Gemmataceae bacterium]|nr:hypothetical protein [Gemmataceae bacterium]
MTILRRFLVLVVLLFWQGGFFFYAAVVVPVGRAALGGDQSIVTRQVTVYLNLAGAVALLPLAWDIWSTPARRNTRWFCWLGMAATLPVLIWLRDRINAAIDPESASVLDSRVFYPNHRWYLWISTVQWALAMYFVLASVKAWSLVDTKAKAIPEERY